MISIIQSNEDFLSFYNSLFVVYVPYPFIPNGLSSLPDLPPTQPPTHIKQDSNLEAIV
jgi:hypothetical protein